MIQGTYGYPITLFLIVPFLVILITANATKAKKMNPVKITRLVSKSKVPVITSNALQKDEMKRAIYGVLNNGCTNAAFLKKLPF